MADCDSCCRGFESRQLTPLASQGLIRLRVVPKECEHNAHMSYVLLAPGTDRNHVLDLFRRQRISSVFHYVPLHSSPGGLRYGRAHGDLSITDDISERLIRLPLWVGLTKADQHNVVDTLRMALGFSAT